MGSPYREPPRYLLCPRCTEMLEAVVPGVSLCPRCEGIWVTAHTLDLAFGNPRWPESHAMWWQNALSCPECMFDGTTTIMDARSAINVQIDRCPTHGLWLDRGELGRVMTTGSDELAELLRRIEATVDVERLAERRQQWQSELRTREQAAGEAMAAHARGELERAEQLRISEQERSVAADQAHERSGAIASRATTSPHAGAGPPLPLRASKPSSPACAPSSSSAPTSS